MSFQCDDVDAGREYIIKGVCVYMGENPDNLIQEYVVCILFSAYALFPLFSYSHSCVVTGAEIIHKLKEYLIIIFIINGLLFHTKKKSIHCFWVDAK